MVCSFKYSYNSDNSHINDEYRKFYPSYRQLRQLSFKIQQRNYIFSSVDRSDME